MSDSRLDNLPTSPQRIALIHPTKFLGNLLLSGGLVQQLSRWCREHNVRLLIVLDESFRALVADAFAEAELVWYPRRLLLNAGDPAAWRAYFRCVRRIRAFQADLAFTIEEDSVSHRLAHFSGARFRVSSTEERYRFGFHAVLPISRSQRPAERKHIWHSYREVFQALGFPVARDPGYMQLVPAPMDHALAGRLEALGVSLERSLAVVHAGATKSYKMWPREHFRELVRRLGESGYQVLLIGAGEQDREVNAYLVDGACNPLAVIDLCDQLSLAELASVLAAAHCMVGNDSGPFHLASALGLPGVVLFGPTDVDIWRPLSDQVTVLENKALCTAGCRRRVCPNDYACLSSITPARVMDCLKLAAASPARV